MSVHMVGLRQEQNPKMKFAVPFLINVRRLGFYMLASLQATTLNPIPRG